ncbi:glycerophosphodiester phosphodiesterase family protein [Roseivirga sp.]|uniref:glycerophosphodiester phosphodiesterase family protein n=1 Tax=Roseivirga sp. TaxID=1964215 RepID=UPI003B527ACA
MSSRTYIVNLFLGFFLFTQCSSPSTATSEQTDVDVSGERGIRIPAGEGKTFFSWTPDRIPMVSAHRGGPYSGYPENALETFTHVASQVPTVIECDIAMTSDSVLIMMHDNALDRTTTGAGQVAEVTYGYIKGLNLVDNNGTVTDYSIPTLDEVLEWAKDKAILTLDVKRGVPFQKVVEAVQAAKAQDYAAIITYNARDAAQVYQLDPDLMISVSLGSEESYQAHHDMGVPDENMIAFVGVSEPEQELYEFLHAKGIYCILGVLGNLDRKAETQGDSTYLGYIQRGADILATDRPLEAFDAIQSLIQTSKKQEYFYGY